jgi:hypothetical protein
MNLKKKNIFLIFLMLCFTITSSIIEIPLKSIEVKDVIKYKDIIIKEVEEEPKENNNFNQISLIDEGSTKISPSRLFLATIKISSNEQEFNLVLDTGSSYLWVPKKDSNDKTKIAHHFVPTSNSVNTNTPFKMEYGTGSCSGTYYEDTIKYINNKKFKFKFGVATVTDFSVEGADGIVGLSNYYSDKSTSIIHRLYEDGITNSKKFSFKFGDNINTGQAGTLYIGEHKDFSKSDTVKCPLINYKDSSNIFWGCYLSKFGIKNSKYEKNSSKVFDVIFDTGTNVIILPLDYLNDIESDLNNFGCEKYIDEKNKNYQLKCKNSDNLPNFRFEINGNVLTVPYQYSFYYVNSKYVYSRIIFKDVKFFKYKIIGSPFFFAFHTLFDQEGGNLYFHPEDIKNLEIGNGINSFTAADLAAIVVIIIVLLGLAYIIYYIIKWKRAKKALEDAIPQSDYVFYNN